MSESKKCTTTAKTTGQATAPLLTPEESCAAAEYLANTLPEWIRAGSLEGTWQLDDLRNLLNAQYKLQQIGGGNT